MATLAQARSDLDAARTDIGNGDYVSARRNVVKAQAALLGVADGSQGANSMRLERQGKDLLEMIDMLESKDKQDSNKDRIGIFRPSF